MRSHRLCSFDFLAEQINPLLDHGLLLGLADDDHTQYLLADGTRALAGPWSMGNQATTNVNIDTGDIATAVTNSEWDAAFAHISQSGASHTFINQGVTTGSSPSFNELSVGEIRIAHEADNSIESITGTIDFEDDNLVTLATITGNKLVSGTDVELGSSGDLILNGGVIKDIADGEVNIDGDLAISGNVTTDVSIVGSGLKLDVTGITYDGGAFNYPVILFSTNVVEGLASGILHFNSPATPAFNMAAGTAGSAIFGGGVDGEASRRFLITAGGTLSWGPGTSGRDVSLSRPKASTLCTFADFEIDSDVRGLILGGDQDAKIYHNGSNLLINNSTGGAIIDTNVAIVGTLVTNEKTKLTLIGGYAIKITNKTGGNTVAGQLIKPDTLNDDAFITIAANDQEIIGIVLDAGIADGSEAWVVVAGIADVLMDAGGSASGDRAISSATAGSADVWNVGGAVATHFQEIGHCIETRVGAGLARCVLHFN